VYYDNLVCVCVVVWHKAAQGLYLAGFVLLLFTLLIACAHICCGCCINSTAIPSFFGFLTLFGCQSGDIISHQYLKVN